MKRDVAADALAANLALRLGACSHDELRVLDVILGRLEKGRADYGPLELDGDPRNWRDEAAEELVDLAIYDACDRLSRRDAQLAGLRREAAAEIASAGVAAGSIADSSPEHAIDLADARTVPAPAASGMGATSSAHEPNGSLGPAAVGNGGRELYPVGSMTPRGRCRCSHEAGDSDCPVHPTCEGCGADLSDVAIWSCNAMHRCCEACCKASWRDVSPATKHVVDDPDATWPHRKFDVGGECGE